MVIVGVAFEQPSTCGVSSPFGVRIVFGFDPLSVLRLCVIGTIIFFAPVAADFAPPCGIFCCADAPRRTDAPANTSAHANAATMSLKPKRRALSPPDFTAFMENLLPVKK
jgi:hypothetical protein